MKRSRLVLIGLGLLAFALALLTEAPSVRSAVSVEALVAFVGSDYYFVAVLAVLALVLGLASVVSGRESTLRQAEMPVPERPFAAATPGDEFDAAACTWRASVPVLGWHRREGVRERLRETAAETIARTENCSLDEAARRVRDGTWTDDPWVAAFLGEGSVPPDQRLAAVIDLDPWFVRGARRSAAAVVSLSASKSTGKASIALGSSSRRENGDLDADDGEMIDQIDPDSVDASGNGAPSGEDDAEGVAGDGPGDRPREPGGTSGEREVNAGSRGHD